jgi:hypothetical protein
LPEFVTDTTDMSSAAAVTAPINAVMRIVPANFAVIVVREFRKVIAFSSA